MMHMTCSTIAQTYESQIREVVDSQVKDNREAIFFIFEDGSTSQTFKGEPTHISLSREQESRIMSQGNLIGSVHSHPSKFDPSTIDVMTGVMTAQESMCVAVPAHSENVDSDFVLSCLDLSKLNISERRRLLRAMRRSSVGITDLGRELRKQAALQRLKVNGCRTHEVRIDGVEFPAADRPSRFSFTVGAEGEVIDREEDVDFFSSDDDNYASNS